MRLQAIGNEAWALPRWLARYKHLLREGAWIAASQLATMVGSLVLVKVLTHRLTPTVYGELALGMTIAGLVNQTLTGPLSNGISRYWCIADEKGAHAEYLAAAWRMIKCATVAVTGLGACLALVLCTFGLLQWAQLTVAALVFSMASGLNAALGGIQNAARQRSVVALHAAMNAWIKIGLATLFVVELGADSSVVLWAYACGTAAVCVSQLYFLHRLLHRREAAAQNRSPGARRWVAEVWGFSWPFAAWGLFTWMQTSSDRWALEFLANTEAVGRYAVLFQLGFTPLTLASGMVVTLLGPIMYQQAGDAADESRIDKVYRSTWAVTILVMGVTLVLAAIFFLCHGWIFRVFASPKFSAASYLLPWMTLAAGLQACHHLLGIRISSVLKTKLILVPQIVSALLISALTVIGTYVDGIEGLIGGLVVASFIYAAWMFVLSENLRSQCPV